MKAVESLEYPRAFRSHTLVQTRPGVYVLKPALRLRVVTLIAVVPGAVIAVSASLLAFEHPGAVAFVVFGAVLVWAGLWGRGPGTRFDLGAGCLTRGYPWRRARLGLSEIAAVELVPAGRLSPDDADPYDTFQLNLVLRGGTRRLNLTNHSDRPASVETGRQLAALLGVAFQEHGPRRGHAG